MGEAGEEVKDEIRIEGLQVFACHGVYPEEREKGQNFMVNAVLYTDTRRAGLEDALEHSTDYGAVCHFITRQMGRQTYRLIEAAAENLARGILLAFPLVSGLELEVRKPEAPIGLPFGSVSVKISRRWHKAYLGVGSNMGDRQEHIRNGVHALSENPEIRVRKVSGLITTQAYGGVEQEDFQNGAAEIETLLTPKELLRELQRIEAEEGRERTVRWGPRTLDLDLLFYDQKILEEEDLVLPHADLQNRYFVLKPMAELAPCLRHPVLGKMIKELLEELQK
ncbi:MAG: 2-amino-4-hydroxy-6-hydroxymethyldihydropteridine diphosphokinase [Clostridium sp.]|jgi:dihydroneopterin aldolase/2-amino-4-hydroxy-6-hydroxymethyldihydropteridine diphosphokinase|nr:2-amino-4-hydroxy-6-hydroxymethyldihydropteridine diphosphokinase [Clostridium sp.]